MPFLIAALRSSRAVSASAFERISRILTIERYDNQRLEALQAAVKRLEGGKTFDPAIDASDSVSRNVQVRAEQSFVEREDPADGSPRSH